MHISLELLEPGFEHNAPHPQLVTLCSEPDLQFHRDCGHRFI